MLEELIFFLITLVLCFLGRYIIFSHYDKKKNKNQDITKTSIEFLYLKKKYKILENKINNRKFKIIISLLDATIMSLTMSIIINAAKNIIIRVLLALVIFLILIYIVYGIFGRILVKKGYDKNEL